MGVTSTMASGDRIRGSEPTKAQWAAIALYTSLMDEVKERMSAIEHAVTGKTGLADFAIREFSYLQLRMICEVIALGCLTAHGDITASNRHKFAREHSAERIIKMMGKLHPNFYPLPYLRIETAPRQFHHTPVESGYLTPTQLIALYRKCGDVLHRGTVQKLAVSPRLQALNIQEIIAAVQEIENLLSLHGFHLLDANTKVLCLLRTPDGKVQTVMAQALEGQ
jgi:hypothetical protein